MKESSERPVKKAANRLPLLSCGVLAVLFIGVLAICANVFLSGDDFHYSAFAKSDLSYYIERHLQHYRLANGRVLVHIIATALLGCNLWIWRILNAAVITACVYFCVRLAAPERKDHFWITTAAAAVILSLDSMITRQSFYWLTGSCNYIFPMFAVLLYWVFLERGSRTGQYRRYLPLLALLAGATTEQGGLMAFGLPIMYIITYFIYDRKKPDKLLLLCAVCSAVGFLTVILAPGQSYRTDLTQSPVDGGLLSLIFYNLKHQSKQLFFSDYMRSVHIPLFSSGLFLVRSMMSQTQSKRLRLFYLLLIIAGSVCLVCYPLISADLTIAGLPNSGITKRLLFVAFISTELLVFAVPALLLYFTKKDKILLFALILAFGSQLAMSVSPVYGPRVVCSFIFMTIVYICRAFALAKCPTSAALAAGVMLYDSGSLLLMPLPFIAVLLQLLRRYKLAALASAAAILAAVSLNWQSLAVRTYENGAVYRENLKAIAAYDLDCGSPLVQKKLPNEYSTWVMPYHNAYYDNYYKLTYNLPQSVEIVWE